MVSNSGNSPCSPTQISSWYDLERICPQDPTQIIAYAEIEGVAGELYFSTSYAEQSWGATPLSVNTSPQVHALQTDNLQKVADAKQWNFSHLTWNDSSTLPIPLQKVIFLRAGTEWENRIYLNFGGTPIQEMQISFLNNAATRGDKQGTIPVLRWTDGTWTGENVIAMVLKKTGQYTLGILTFDGTDYAMYELVIVSVA